MDEKLNIFINNYLKKYNKELTTCETIEDVKSLVNSYEKINLNDFDNTKKKRAKNIIQPEERCQAVRANNSQCTRRKKSDCLFCGTHVKGRPYGVIKHDVVEETKKTLQVFTQEIEGILYYIDDNGNIYNTEDIINKIVNPQKVGRYDLINNKFVRI